ncbi:MAG: hypothetical protein ACTHMM_21230 [Agriterribacter sp.]
MEKIQDFFKQAGERLRNPFLFSFLISWLVANYKIVIGLCFYSMDKLKVDGYASYLDLIEKESNWCRGLVYPLIGASIYTFGFPYFRRFIVLLYTRINKRQEEKTLKILEGGSVSVKKYLRLREDYKESEKRLTKVIEEDSEFMSQRTDLHNQIDKLKSIMEEKEKLIQVYEPKSYNYDNLLKALDVGFLTGKWDGMYSLQDGEQIRIVLTIDVEIRSIKFVVDNIPFPKECTISALARDDRTIFFSLTAFPPAVLPAQIGRHWVLKILHEHHLQGIASNGTHFDFKKRVDDTNRLIQ